MQRRSFLVAALSATLPSLARAQDVPAPGELLITGFRGTEPGDPEVERVRGFLEAGLCAGVLLLRRNCVSPEQISRLTSVFRAGAGALAPVVAIDQEGGRVARLDAGNGFLDWMSAQAIASSGMRDDEIVAYWTERARQLSAVGINVNLAPVVDLDINPENPIIGKLGRSFGADPDQVTRLAGLFIAAHRAAGVKTSIKHFPGHGSTTTDSHKDIADVSATWRPVELAPYADLIHSGAAESVMNAHLLHPDYSDPPGLPTSISRKSVQAIREMGFSGPIFSDDMQMAAVEEVISADEAALASVNAGNTFLIYSNYQDTAPIDTVERIAAGLIANRGRISPPALAAQIALARQFRAQLR